MAHSPSNHPRNDAIQIHGARVHNLRAIDVTIPRNQLTWLTGVSGSGKSSLAIDTLYAEGQRRYIEGFSAYARQFLDRLDRPDVDEINHLPPAIALRAKSVSRRNQATVAMATELHQYLRGLFARLGQFYDRDTGKVIHRESPENVAKTIPSLPKNRRYLIAFPPDPFRHDSPSRDRLIDRLLENGLTRAVVDGQIVRLDHPRAELPSGRLSHVIVDRLTTGRGAMPRIVESLETAFQLGEGIGILLLEGTMPEGDREWTPMNLDDQLWHQRICRRRPVHPRTGQELPDPTPELFNPRSPWGGCHTCGGRGYVGEKKTAVKNQNLASELCLDCHGAGLNPAALSVYVDGLSIAEWQKLSAADARVRVNDLAENISFQSGGGGNAAGPLLSELVARLDAILAVGLGYLSLDRPIGTLSTGESRRLALTAARCANLVNLLYVLDEPTAGLHPRDRHTVLAVLKELRDGPNTVVVIDHDPAFGDAADWIIELGPGAGREGGTIVYQGSPDQFPRSAELDQKPLAGKPTDRQQPILETSVPSLTLANCRQRNLQIQTVHFPWNQLVVVAGVSGSGKSTLIAETLYPAVARELGIALPDIPATEATASGADPLEDIVLVDQSAVGRTIRSNAVTYLNAFDAIRAAFAAVPEAKLRNLGRRAFSFNAASGGRCQRCRGAGRLRVDMQFLPDIEVACPECGGSRFRNDILEIKLRGRSIAEALEMTADEAFSFFRGHGKILRRIAPLREVGLGYLPLGQPTSTLSSGEIQRLKVASFLAERNAKRTLFLFDEPTIGLHASDVATLLESFRRLIAVGHSVIAIEHRLQFLRAADWIIELGPGAGPDGGKVIAAGPPAHLAIVRNSPTGACLAKT